MTEHYDTVIVGAGPAGLSAAIMLGRCRRRVLLCDGGGQRNLASLAVHGLLGHEGLSPAQLLAKGRRELEKYPTVVIHDVEVRSITKEGDVFRVVCADSGVAQAAKVLLATGIVDDVPKIEGIDGLYGRSVHHCPYCDGFEHRDQPIAVYGAADKGAGLACMMKLWSSDVILCTDGGAAPGAEAKARLADLGVAVHTEPIARLEGTSNGELRRIVFRSGASLGRTALFFTTGCSQRSSLWQELGCARDEKNGIITDPLTEESSVAGVYVAGDISRDVLLVSVAAAEGAKAGVAINRALLKRDGLA